VDALNILREKTIAIPLAGTTEDANANEDGNGNNDSGGVDTNKRHNATGKIGDFFNRGCHIKLLLRIPESGSLSIHRYLYFQNAHQFICSIPVSLPNKFTC
jgi:hypothetical protein